MSEVGRLGVDLFFAISGFLITSRLASELGATGTLRLRSFYLRRGFRILPPALLFLALVSAMALRGMWRPSPREWFASILFYRNYVDGRRMTDHLWSLSIEEHFYATWPLLLLVCARARRALVVVPAIAIAVAVWRLLVVRGVVSVPIPGNLAFRTDIRFDALLWGAALALARRADAGRARIAKWISRPVWLAAAAAFMASGFIAEVDVQASLLGGTRTPSRARRALAAGFAVAAVRVILSVMWFRDGTLIGPHVVLYADSELCGKKRDLGVGRYDLTRRAGIGNDVVSSLRVGTTARVRLCDDVKHGEPGGDCRDFGPGAMVLHLDDFNDRASFIEVTAAE